MATFKTKSSYKVELFYLFAPPFWNRLLPTKSDKTPSSEDIALIDAVFGCNLWQQTYAKRAADLISPETARWEYLNLMETRITGQLGYKYTRSIEVCNTQGSVLYYMIFATDHIAGIRIMDYLMTRAERVFPKLQLHNQQLRDKIAKTERGVYPLFDMDDVDPEISAVVKALSKQDDAPPQLF